MLTDTDRITSSLDLDDYALLAQKASKAYFPIFCSFLCLITKWNISWGKMRNVFRSISNTLKLVFPSMMTYPLANIHTVKQINEIALL